MNAAEAFDSWWSEQTRKGDPARRSNLARDAFIAAFELGQSKIDPRDPDPSRPGIFRDHNCAYCSNGEKPCKQGGAHRCSNPQARND